MICPGCGSSYYQSNLIDETPYVVAAQDAPQLKHFGQLDAAACLLGALGTVRLVNFLRPKWRCLECGGKFDD
ncbi:MAG: hypothetical protein ACOY45_04560 [Pseudomonadota bacterium]